MTSLFTPAFAFSFVRVSPTIRRLSSRFSRSLFSFFCFLSLHPCACPIAPFPTVFAQSLVAILSFSSHSFSSYLPALLSFLFSTRPFSCLCIPSSYSLAFFLTIHPFLLSDPANLLVALCNGLAVFFFCRFHHFGRLSSSHLPFVIFSIGQTGKSRNLLILPCFHPCLHLFGHGLAIFFQYLTLFFCPHLASPRAHPHFCKLNTIIFQFDLFLSNAFHWTFEQRESRLDVFIHISFNSFFSFLSTHLFFNIFICMVSDLFSILSWVFGWIKFEFVKKLNLFEFLVFSLS